MDLRVLLVLHLVANPKHRCDAMVYAERVKIADPVTAAVKASAPAESAEIEVAEDA